MGYFFMANLNGFKFFDFHSTHATSAAFSNPNFGEAMTLQVEDGGSANFSLRIQGMNDLEELDKWYDIGILDLKNYKKLDAITTEGLYVVPLEGLYKIRIVNDGTPGGFKVYGISTGIS